MKRILYIVAGLLAVVSCSVEPIQPEVEILVPVTLVADMSGTETKAVLNDREVLWSEGDKLAVYDGTAIREFTLTSGAGTKHATFAGEVSPQAESLYAVHPYEAASLQDGEVKVSLRSSQKVSSGSIDPRALVMTATAAPGGTLQFRNFPGLLRFSVPAGVSSVKLLLQGHNAVTVSLPGTGGTYDAAFTPGEYNGLVALAESEGKWYGKTAGEAIEIVRNKIKTIGALPLSDEVLLINNESEMAAFLSSTGAEDTRTVVLGASFNMKDSYDSGADFAGVFEGAGCTFGVKGQPLFISNHGTIRNLTLRGSIKSSSVLESAPLAIRNYGTVTGVTNTAAVQLSATEAVFSPIVLGGIAAYNYGSISDCRNEGNIGFSGTAAIGPAALGGIAGYSEAPLGNCSNSGEITLSAMCGSTPDILGNIQKSATNIGGILGAGYTAAPVTACVNEGLVSVFFSATDKANVVYERCQVGGIVGSPYGDVTDCVNHGTVSVEARSSNTSAAGKFITNTGGIAGGSYTQGGTASIYNPDDATSIIGCLNDGPVNIYLDASTSNSTFGGIVGWPNGEVKNLNCKTTNCENRGNITMDGAGKVRIGGIMGGTGPLENCTNSGKILVNSANSASVIGGICAFHSQDHALSGCSNTGDVISKVAIDGVGGLIGNHGNVNLSSSTGCSVDCRVENAADTNLGTGIILGRYNGTTASTIGSEDSPVDVKGTVVFGNTTIKLDENNYEFYLCGTYSSSDGHKIYAVCKVPGQPDVYIAEGHVTYDGSEPAAGISVSDGFLVAVTDADGYYKIATCSDTRYIYVSYPADAAIEKHSDGTPAFFAKYEKINHTYDFNFTRQPVENEFMIFAMADPQAHYSKRETQPKADTDRFRDEAVAAINAQIDAQSAPCYGVTLGDIVYSENGRDSNSGMPTMRTHFKGVNMPVFQTMGNHDFTHFYTNKPLTTDETTSTLYLAAQRKFEDCFGPVNLSFNRGNVHFVCMRNIIFDSNTDNTKYHGGFTDAQYSWLQQDLANVPKDRMVVVCVHIPFVGILNNEHVKDVLNLMKQYASAKVFSGHTHYKRYYANLNSTGIAEHIHSAVCGQWWWSNIEGDGCPNGYTVYKFSGTQLTDEYFIGQNNHMNTRDYQMRVYRGNLKTGGSYAYFQWPHSASKLMINVFNGDSRWTVKVYENGVFSGNASMMANKKSTYSSVTAGETYTVPEASNQDWWAIGYHIGVKGRGTKSTSYYTNMFHMYTYTLKNANASVKVVATDGYGNSYECTDIVETDCWYPDYIKQGNVN